LPGERQGAQAVALQRLAQVIVQSTRRPGEIRIEAVKEGWDGPELTPAKVTITTKVRLDK
jgi:hypothetical protein